ncbi:zinc-ribbon domain-containing protein [Thermococcus thermotolerans]|uniref:zinc-ribbon domain-containing protein n=1 Tax=Thermococcus thermotolerans TaxID=2969672 RepID=UPI002157F0E2|nr:zinc-ribbon domain-containing protein [Thermococcus thermotolerans]
MEVQCPTCSAKFKVPDTVSIATCPYCGTTFHVHTGEESPEEHFFFPPMRKDAGGVLLKFLSRQYGAPADITGAKVTKKELHWVPVYFFYLHGRSKRWSTIEEVRFVGIPAGSPFQGLLKDYPFPIRGKRFFDESVVKKGRYYEPKMSKEEAEAIARKLMEGALRSEASQEDKSLGDFEVEVNYLGLVHYPLWEVHYEYGGQNFVGYIDGTDGRVVQAEYPLMSGARKKASLLGTGVLAAGLIIGIITAGAYGSAWGLIGGLIPGGAGAFGIFRKGAVKKRKVSEVTRVNRGNLYFKPM